MITLRTLVILLIVAIFFPPFGIPLLIGWIALATVRHLGRDGGPAVRRRNDAWAKAPVGTIR